MRGSCLSLNALSSVPGSVVVAATVNIVLSAVSLALTQVLDSAKLISRNGFNVLDNLLHNDGLGVLVFNTLMMDSLRSTVE